MKNKCLWLALASSFLTTSALAGTMGPVAQPSNWNWVATFSAGPVWGGSGATQTFFLTPEIEKTYLGNKSTQALFDGEIFLGRQQRLTPIFYSRLGLAVAATSDASLSGEIWDDASPEFNNYVYSYKIQHTHLALKGMLLADAGFWLTPWVSGSLGVGFNNAHGFHNYPIIFEALPTPNFSSRTQTSFTYTLGAGVQKALSERWQVGVGYEFADWGKSNLERAAQQTLASGLALNHLYTNGVLFNLTYVA